MLLAKQEAISLCHDIGFSRKASLRLAHAFIRCYLREIALPKGDVSLDGLWLTLRLPYTGRALEMRVRAASLTGNFAIVGGVFIDGEEIDARHQGAEILSLVVAEMERLERSACHFDLIDQATDCLRVWTVLESQSRPRTASARRPAISAYLLSEQHLHDGHPFHPTPKSRIGFSDEDLRRFSPEWHPTFSLHYFWVARELAITGAAEESDIDHLLTEGSGLNGNASRMLLPVHPWQAARLLSEGTVLRAMENGDLGYVGVGAAKLSPTSSVRTVYDPERDRFLKLSLNVRITNCFRRNSLPEMRAAMLIADACRGMQAHTGDAFPGFGILRELAFASIDIPELEAAERKSLQEGFGVIVREGLGRFLTEGDTPLLSAHLFQFTGEVERSIFSEWRGWQRAAWLDKYLNLLLPPLLHMFFEEGIATEPHLQNVIVCLRDHLPSKVILRDFDNCKIVENGPATRWLARAQPEVRSEVTYDEPLAWSRFAYCLFTNHLCDAVTAIAGGSARLEQALWKSARSHLEDYLARSPSARAKAQLGELLRGKPFPAKNNLRTRFAKGRDKDAAFSAVPNPMGGV